MLKFKLSLLIFLCGYLSFTYSGNKNGFDEICTIYTEAVNSSMSSNEKSDYIFNNIKKRISSMDAIQAHDAVFSLEPDKRYSIFKKSAEYSLKHKWSCKAVSQLMR